jgi:hypothetical protein
MVGRYDLQKNQTASSLLEICKLDVQQNFHALEYVKEQTYEIIEFRNTL